MKTQMYALRDNLCDFFTPPFFSVHEADAIRSVGHLVNSDADTPICKSPGDFTLYNLGSYDDHTGAFEILPQPSIVTNCDVLLLRDQND